MTNKNSHLQAQLEARVQQLERMLSYREHEIDLLKETADVINSELDLERVYQGVAEHAQKLIDAETVLVPILNDNCSEYTYHAACGMHAQEIVGETLGLNIGVCGWVWRNQRAWWCGVLDELSEEDRKRWEKKAKSIIVVPLMGRHHFLGGLVGINKKGGRDFDKRDLELLTMFANQVSITIENAGFFSEITQEIAERKLIEADLDNAKLAAEAANVAKSQFLAKMSHEMRTPLNAIIGYSELLHELAQEKGHKNYFQDLNIIGVAGKHLLDLINDILDLAKIESGEMHLESIILGIWDIVKNVVQLFTKRAQAKGLALVLNVSEQVPKKVRGDPVRVQQIIMNLVGNAIKFTQQGTVTITLSAQQERPDAAMLRLEVIDTGIGISPENQKTIFNPFMQADDSSTRQHEGTGLGLAITREILAKMGGEIGVCSELGGGSTFWATFWLGKV